MVIRKQAKYESGGSGRLTGVESEKRLRSFVWVRL